RTSIFNAAQLRNFERVEVAECEILRKGSDTRNCRSSDIGTRLPPDTFEHKLLDGVFGRIDFGNTDALEPRPHGDAEDNLGEEVGLVQHRAGMATRAETVLRIREV